MTWAPCPHGVRTRGKKYHPPVGNEELGLSFLLAHCIVNVENKLATLLNVCTFHLT